MSPQECREERKRLGWSRAQLARRAHVSVPTVGNFENGVRVPVRNNLLAIARAIKGDTEPQPQPVVIDWNKKCLYEFDAVMRAVKFDRVEGDIVYFARLFNRVVRYCEARGLARQMKVIGCALTPLPPNRSLVRAR